MELILNITSYHRLSPEIEAIKKVENSLNFGRSDSCDWHLPDPEKIISSSHGKIVREGTSFYIYDESTNGLFVNFSVTPIGAGNKHLIVNKDVFSIGDFQVEAILEQPEQSTSPSQQRLMASQQMQNSSEPYPNSSPVAPAYNAPSPANDLAASAIHAPLNLGEYMEAPKTANAENQGAFQIPENWGDMAPTVDSSAVHQQPVHQQPFEQKPLEQQLGQVVQSQQPVEPQIQQPVLETPVVANQTTQSNVSQQPSEPNVNEVNDVNYKRAFFEGLGVTNELANQLDNEKLWLEMGKSLNLLLSGVMDSLRQRTTVKNQLKLNHTMFQSQQNNPLKFSATLDDVIQNLFVRNSTSFLSYDESIREVFTDTQSHETALIAGASGTVKGVLEQLLPNSIKEQAVEHSNVGKYIPGQVEAKSWKLYMQLYNDLAAQVNSKGAMALSDDFLKAYEQTSKNY